MHAHMEPTLASAKATTTNCNCYSRLLLLLLFLLGSNKRLGAQTCSLCVGVATARMLRQLSCCCDAHTQLTEVQTLLLLCCCCCGCACVVSICILGRALCRCFCCCCCCNCAPTFQSNMVQGIGGRGGLRTISYYIIYQLNRSIICKLPEHIKFEQRHTHSNTLTQINTLTHTLTRTLTMLS